MPTYKKTFTALKGDFYDETHYNEIIKESAIGLKENGEVLFVFVKGSIKEENREKYIEALKSNAKTKTKNRGTAAGVAEVSRFPKDAVSLCKKDGTPLTNPRLVSVQYKRADGTICGRCQSNAVRSGCAGYFDAVAGLPCRMVGWSTRNPEKHLRMTELCEEIGNAHKENEPISYNFQRSKSHKDYLMGDSPYSTMTLNYDFRTACHIDRGDLINSLSTLTILEEIPNNYKGCYLGLPEYKIAVDIRSGDTLIFDAHEFHANTEMNVLSDKLPINDLTGEPYGGRISIVAYLRNRISECPDLAPDPTEDY
tara:strand:- start:8619 stop:9548 length:930 start_codon:yes stop_codon:yes gene_type:complete